MWIFVLDCSAAMSYFFKDEASARVETAFEALAAGGKALVPPIWPLEILNTCLSAEKRKRMTSNDTETILSILETLPIEMASTPLNFFEWKFLSYARKYQLTSYDASYLELAVRKGIPLLTLDKALAKAAAKSGTPLWNPAAD